MGERFEKGDVLRVPIGVTLGAAEHYGLPKPILNAQRLQNSRKTEKLALIIKKLRVFQKTKS